MLMLNGKDNGYGVSDNDELTYTGERTTVHDSTTQLWTLVHINIRSFQPREFARIDRSSRM